MSEINQYEGTCFICGDLVKGLLVKGKAYQNDLGYWQSGGYKVRHAHNCSPVRIRIVFTGGHLDKIMVDRKAIILIDDDAKANTELWGADEMFPGNIFSFDLEIKELKK